MSHEVEVYEPGKELAAAPAPTQLIRAEDPAEFVKRSQQIADALVAVVQKQGLVKEIQGRKHPLVEAWTFLGSMMGAFGSAVFAVEDWTKPIMGHYENGVVSYDPNGPVVIGWEARVEARTAEGAVVGAAESMCMRSEKMWGFNPTNRYGKALDPRDDFALRSMAQTRATSKALRQPLGFLMQLAGYDPTPEAEMAEPPMPEPPKLADPILIDQLVEVLSVAESIDPERWATPVVLANASRAFGREIKALTELTMPEAQRIGNGATQFLQEEEDKMTKPEVPDGTP